MPRLRSTCLSAAALGAVLLSGRAARAQACCAGAGALTPGRLALHEDALVGTQLHASTVLGSFDDAGRYTGAPGSNTSELDFEEDLFGALRVFKRGQVALLVPFVETRRADQGVTDFGGGIGDVNLSVRYDFYLAGQSRILPGIAALAGLTAPTGTPPDKAHDLLAAQATGVGAWQANGGVALEQIVGPWLFNVTELVAWRAPRTVQFEQTSQSAMGSQTSSQSVSETLGLQLVTLAGGAYTFDDEGSIAVFGSYTTEGQATLNGASSPDSARRSLLLSISGAHPLTDAWRVQGGISFVPPIAGLGRNQTATYGLVFTLIRSWS